MNIPEPPLSKGRWQYFWLSLNCLGVVSSIFFYIVLGDLWNFAVLGLCCVGIWASLSILHDRKIQSTTSVNHEEKP